MKWILFIFAINGEGTIIDHGAYAFDTQIVCEQSEEKAIAQVSAGGEAPHTICTRTQPDMVPGWKFQYKLDLQTNGRIIRR